MINQWKSAADVAKDYFSATHVYLENIDSTDITSSSQTKDYAITSVASDGLTERRYFPTDSERRLWLASLTEDPQDIVGSLARRAFPFDLTLDKVTDQYVMVVMTDGSCKRYKFHAVDEEGLVLYDLGSYVTNGGTRLEYGELAGAIVVPTSNKLDQYDSNRDWIESFPIAAELRFLRTRQSFERGRRT